MAGKSCVEVLICRDGPVSRDDDTFAVLFGGDRGVFRRLVERADRV
jgi:hypothetical protein